MSFQLFLNVKGNDLILSEPTQCYNKNICWHKIYVDIKIYVTIKIYI